MANITFNGDPIRWAPPEYDREIADRSETRVRLVMRPAPLNPYVTPPSSAFSLGMHEESIELSADDPESGQGEDFEPVMIPQMAHVAVATVENIVPALGTTNASPVELTNTLDMIPTVTSTYTDNAAAKVDPPGLSVWVGSTVVLAFLALVLTCGEIVGWGTRMGWTTATRPLIAPRGADHVLSRVLAALCSAAGVLIWVAVVTIWVSGRMVIERAARRPILPVFLEAVRNQAKLSNAVVRPGWRAVVLGISTAFGACAGAALLAAAAVAPATHTQRALFASAVAFLDAWALFYLCAVGTVGFYGHKLLTFLLIFGVISTSISLYLCIFVFGVGWYYVAPYAMFLVLSALCVVFGSIAWQNRNERVELRGVW